MNEFYGSTLIITGKEKYIGEDEDPITNPLFVAYVKALKEIYQPERLNPEDVRNDVCDSLTSMET